MREKERSRIRVQQASNFWSKLGTSRINKILNSGVKGVYIMRKVVGDKIYENILLWFRHMKTMENNRTDKKARIRESHKRSSIRSTEKKDR